MPRQDVAGAGSYGPDLDWVTGISGGRRIPGYAKLVLEHRAGVSGQGHGPEHRVAQVRIGFGSR